MTKKYATAKAFRTALEEKLTTLSKKEKTDIQRIRKQVCYDRLLSRLFSKAPSPWLLKGGYAMQLRMQNARGTQDVDLAMKELKNDTLGELLREYAAIDLGDFFKFTVTGPILDLEAPPYGGARFHIETQIDNRSFEKFHLDIGIGDAWIEPIDGLTSRDWLEFAGFPA